jgi:hypothetical protein
MDLQQLSIEQMPPDDAVGVRSVATGREGVAYCVHFTVVVGR